MFFDDPGHQAECHTCFQIYTADEETDGIQFGRDLPGAVCHGFGIGACLEPDENDPVTNGPSPRRSSCCRAPISSETGDPDFRWLP